MLIPVIAACSDNEPTTSNETSGTTAPSEEVTETEAVDILEQLNPNIPAVDYNGYEFHIVTRNDTMHDYPVHTRDIFAESSNGEPMNDAVYRRNSEVEEKFNIKIIMDALDESDESRPNKAVIQSVSAGDDTYDLFMTHEINGSGTAAGGYLLNWNTIPYIDMSMPWWCAGATSDLTVGDKIFLALSDLSVSSNDNCYLILFNKQHQEDYEIEDMYTLANEGTWTFDKMQAIVKDIYSDLNGDGKMTEDDLYGLINGGGQANWFYAANNRVALKDENNRPTISPLTDRIIQAFEKSYDIVVGEHAYNFTSWIDVKIVPMFAKGNGVLMTTQIGIVPQLRNMEVDFGALPFPKLDESQDLYYNYVDGHAQLMGIPKTASNLERTGAIIEELSYLSRKYVVPAYYEINLKTKFSRDEESSKMLDYVLDGRIFDFGYVYNNWVGPFAFGTGDQMSSKKREIVSLYESNINKVQANLEKVLEAYDAIE
jgi:hypothetical protein